MKDNRIKKLGFNIKIERLRQNYSKLQLANLANISIESVQKIESGKQTPSVFMFFDIINALNIPVETVYHDMDKSE